MRIEPQMQKIATATCTTCPKACHGTCPVSAATRSETTTAWGKMTAASVVANDGQPMDEETSTALHACTGCGRCTTACLHENPVGPTLFSMRGRAIVAGVQPQGASGTLATFQQAQNPFGHELGALVSAFRAQAPVRYPLFPGCSSLVKRSALVEETLVVAEAFGAPMGVSRSSSKCCGYPLYAAGAHETFLAHALSVSSAFAETPEVAVLDPGCAFTFRKLYPAFGVQVHSRVRTVVEVLFEHVLHAPHQPKLSLRVGYHDACHLGRGLGQYDEPRSLLSLAVVDVMEAASVRREGGCSGGGGLLPRTMADVSVEVARLQAADVSRESSVAVVSACPTSSRMFERAGRTSMDFIGVLNRWLRQS